MEAAIMMHRPGEEEEEDVSKGGNGANGTDTRINEYSQARAWKMPEMVNRFPLLRVKS